MAVVNNNPEFVGGQYFEKMHTGFADVDTPWQKYDIESQILRGTMTFSRNKLQELDPAYTGYTHIFVLRMPYFMECIMNGHVFADFYEDAQAMAKYHYNNLKQLLEMGSTSYSGTPNMTMDTTDVNVGWNERNYAAPTKSQYDGNQFTIKCLETRGEPLRLGMEWYLNCISDAVGKFTHLGGAMHPVTKKPLEPSLANYTFSIMVVQTDQTLLRIQNIDLWNNAFFTEAPRDNLDWSQGEIDIVQPRDIQFRGVYLPVTTNKACMEKAKQLMHTRSLWYKRIEDLTPSDLRLDSSTDGDYGSGDNGDITSGMTPTAIQNAGY